MCKICVFAGTTEGRRLTEFLSGQNVQVTVCVATEYGETLIPPAENLQISARRLKEEEMRALFEKETFDLCVDATHPYAPVVTENISEACEKTGTAYLRLLRSGADAPEDAYFAEDISQAVAYLNETEGKILLTTGSKELSQYMGIRDFENRVYSRVLPMEESLKLCTQAGLKPSHILAMQGPFTKEMNAAMLKSIGASYMVTKQSGTAGGFDEKIAAARESGARLIVIGRPPQKEGLSYGQTISFLCDRFSLHRIPEVTIVGIGPGSRQTMTREALDAMDHADCLIGARRMLEAALDGVKPSHAAIAPEDISDFIHSSPEYGSFCVVMSGDTGFFSGTRKLLPLLKDCRVSVLPGLSSLQVLCAKLQTSYEDVMTVSAHGRDKSILPQIRRHHRVFTLLGGDNGAGKLAQELVQAGLSDAILSIGENLSYPDEKITRGTALEISKLHFTSLSAALIENPNSLTGFGLPDSAFSRGQDGLGVVPMTKSEVRAVALSKLQLTEDAVCWDIGSGTGSVTVEMALAACCGQVYGIERRQEAAALSRENAKTFGADNVTIVEGLAPEACVSLPGPTHVFIGGSAGNMREILSLVLKRNPCARIVATAIALESVAELTECMKAFPFAETEVLCLTAARDKKAGPYHLMTGQNPIYIFTMQGGKKA